MRQLQYFCVYGQQIKRFRYLGKQRAADVLFAMFDYFEEGIHHQELDDASMMMLLDMQERFDRSLEVYEQKCNKLKSNGNKGGRPKKPNGFSNNQQVSKNNYQQQVQSAANETKCKEQNRTEQNKSEQNKTNQNKTTISISSYDDVIAIRNDHDEIFNAAADAGFGSQQATLNILTEMYADYGKQIVLDGIKACVRNGVVKLTYLQKVCRNLKGGDKHGNEGAGQDPANYDGFGIML